MSYPEKIALIAGSGNFPLFVAKAAKSNNVDIVAIAVNSEADKKIEEIASKTYWIDLGQAKRLLAILKEEKIKKAIMAGKISKMTIVKESLRLDEEAKKVVSGVLNRKDDTLLLAVANRLKLSGVDLLDSTTFVKDIMPKKGILTKQKPTKAELDDIKFGFDIAKEMGRIDIGQSVVVKNKAVIAVEAIEGTDEAIKRAGELAGARTVVIKVSKPNQDMRFDVPVVGLKTIEALKNAGSSVLAIEAGKVLMLEKEQVVEEADNASISIVAV